MSFPWMPLHVAKYIGDTMHLTTLEHGAYLLLIMHYWQRGGVPTEDRSLASITKLTLDQWLEIKPTIGALFQSGWKHKRIDAELATAYETHAKRSASGKRAAYARYNKRMPDASETDQPTHANLPKEDSSSSETLVPPSLRARIFNVLGEPIGFLEEGELNAQLTRYPNVDFETRLAAIWRWGVKEGKGPDDIKAIWRSKLEDEAASTALVNAPKAKAQASEALTKSRLVTSGPRHVQAPAFLVR